jgi:hypothetical protein
MGRWARRRARSEAGGRGGACRQRPGTEREPAVAIPIVPAARGGRSRADWRRKGPRQCDRARPRAAETPEPMLSSPLRALGGRPGRWSAAPPPPLRQTPAPAPLVRRDAPPRRRRSAPLRHRPTCAAAPAAGPAARRPGGGGDEGGAARHDADASGGAGDDPPPGSSIARPEPAAAAVPAPAAGLSDLVERVDGLAAKWAALSSGPAPPLRAPAPARACWLHPPARLPPLTPMPVAARPLPPLLPPPPTQGTSSSTTAWTRWSGRWWRSTSSAAAPPPRMAKARGAQTWRRPPPAAARARGAGARRAWRARRAGAPRRRRASWAASVARCLTSASCRRARPWRAQAGASRDAGKARPLAAPAGGTLQAARPNPCCLALLLPPLPCRAASWRRSTRATLRASRRCGRR